jgi:hypothetical protein
MRDELPPPGPSNRLCHTVSPFPCWDEDTDGWKTIIGDGIIFTIILSPLALAIIYVILS